MNRDTEFDSPHGSLVFWTPKTPDLGHRRTVLGQGLRAPATCREGFHARKGAKPGGALPVFAFPLGSSGASRVRIKMRNPRAENAYLAQVLEPELITSQIIPARLEPTSSLPISTLPENR